MHALPITYSECETIYSRTIDQGVRRLLFAAPSPGEGTSTIAYAVAQRAVSHGHKVLLLDFNTFHSYPRDVLGIEAQSWTVSDIPESAFFNVTPDGLTILPAPIERTFGVASRTPEDMRRMLDRLAGQFDIIIGDAPGLLRQNASGIAADTLVGSFEQVMLVVAALECTRATLDQAFEKIRSSGAQVTGVVLNDRNNPMLGAELTRQARKLGPLKGIMLRLFQSLFERLSRMEAAN